MMQSRPQKGKCSSSKNDGRDRLSEMPDEIIVRILSCMSTLDAVRTLLLRRFGNLWTLVPALTFNINMHEFDGYRCSNDEFMRFFLFGRNVLMFHKCCSIDKFHLCVETESCEKSIREAVVDDVEMWLRFALDRQAKEIVFSYSSDYGYAIKSCLPKFTSQSLLTLELSGCEISLKYQVNLGSLKKLSLEHVTMCEAAFEQFVSGCPSLQKLRIVNPLGIEKLSFSAPNIDNLSLDLTEDGSALDIPWLFDFPNLKSLGLRIDYLPDIIDVSSVRDIDIEYLYDLTTNSDDKLARLELFLRKFEGCEVFRLSHHASDALLEVIQHLSLSHIKWKRVILELNTFFDGCLLGIHQLARSLKYLEELTICTRQYLCPKAGLLSEEVSSPCVMPKLKRVNLRGYTNPWDRQLQLVEFLLKSAPVLDKLIFVHCKYRRLTAEKELEFVKRVSTFHRLSPTASVVFA